MPFARRIVFWRRYLLRIDERSVARNFMIISRGANQDSRMCVLLEPRVVRRATG